MNNSGVPHGLPSNVGNSKHAELDALGQAAKRSLIRPSMVMYIDNSLCGFCKRCGDGLPEVMKQLGIDELIVHDPYNSWLITVDGHVQLL
jgi:hypothetical protein